MPKLLLVEDEVMILEPLEIVLRSAFYELDSARDGLVALEHCSKNTYDLILLDLMMPNCNGIEFLKKANLQVTAPQTKVIILTNLDTGNMLEEAKTLGNYKVVLKADVTPIKLIELVKEELNGEG